MRTVLAFAACLAPATAWATEGDALLGLLGQGTSHPEVRALLKGQEPVESLGATRYELETAGLVVELSEEDAVQGLGIMVSSAFTREDGTMATVSPFPGLWPLDLPMQPDWDDLSRKLGEAHDMQGAIDTWTFGGVDIVPTSTREGEVGVVWFNLADPTSGPVDVEAIAKEVKDARPGSGAVKVERVTFVGVGWGAYLQLDSGLDSVVDTYNGDRGWLDPTLSKAAMMHGFSLSASTTITGPLTGELAFSMRSAGSTAEGTPPTYTAPIAQDIVVRESGVGLGVGYALLKARHASFDLGALLQVGTHIVRARLRPVPDTWRDDSNLGIGIAVRAQYVQALPSKGAGPAIAIRPYVAMALGSRDYIDTYENLSPDVPASNADDFKSTPITAGLQVHLGVFNGS
jgi:hypothetical protein